MTKADRKKLRDARRAANEYGRRIVPVLRRLEGRPAKRATQWFAGADFASGKDQSQFFYIGHYESFSSKTK